VPRTRRQNGDKEIVAGSLCDPLKHPERVRILEIVNEAPMSPIRFLRGGYATRGFKNKQEGLSYLSYHFRELEKAGLIDMIESVPRRGAMEHVYRGVGRVFYTNEEFDKLPLRDRMMLSRTSFQGLVARTDRALGSGTFDNRTNRQLTWRAMHLDEQGWQEMVDHLDEAFAKAEAIREAASERIRKSDGEKTIPATVAFLGYESPPLPPLD
jgi:DNA-binding transcriptional ArsR family regulator